MITPKFSYNSVSFIPAYPPVQKPLSLELDATRHDSLTTGGLKQSILERIDGFLTLNFSFAPQSDMAAWAAFMAWALAGNHFTYYPDSTDQASHADYTMEDLTWAPKRTAFGHASFSFRIRQVVS